MWSGRDIFIIRVHFYLGNQQDKNDYCAAREADGPAGVHQGVFVPQQLRLAIHNTHVGREELSQAHKYKKLKKKRKKKT